MVAYARKMGLLRLVLPNRNFNVWCVDRTVDEGRKAAMRWLIEFIGLILKPGKPAKNGKFAENEKAAAPTPHPNGKSVTIRQVGGIMFDTTRQDALKLAKICKHAVRRVYTPLWIRSMILLHRMI